MQERAYSAAAAATVSKASNCIGAQSTQAGESPQANSINKFHQLEGLSEDIQEKVHDQIYGVGIIILSA